MIVNIIAINEGVIRQFTNVLFGWLFSLTDSKLFCFGQDLESNQSKIIIICSKILLFATILLYTIFYSLSLKLLKKNFNTITL